ncbi:hypothetical protein BDZ89DRAFT_1138556 [Hymenopellis radicata]|nr:hypothetical protein BDZ89DRAFT_1138556 [Hymenopellis radicata]
MAVEEEATAADTGMITTDVNPWNHPKTNCVQQYFDPVEELPQLEQQIRELQPPNIPNIAEALRIGVTEQPYKIPHYAALLRLLHEQPSEGTSLGRQLLEEIWKGFQTYVDQLSWRETRFCIHFFSHLALAGIISPDSLATLLQSFTAVLDEFGVSQGRAKRAALCAGEGLMIAGSILPPSSPEAIITAIEAFNESTKPAKALVHPMVLFDGTSENADELLDALLASCHALQAPGATLTICARSPEVTELEGTEDDAPVKKEEWPENFVQLFENDVTPDFKTPEGYVIRVDLMAIVDIFEVNRKECARLLLEYPKWTLPGTFKPKLGAPAAVDPVLEKDWLLENTMIETILGAYFLLPEASQKSIYYMGVITELCKLSPQSVGPAVGKSIRKLFGYLADGLDVDVSRRFAEWFAIHMSNFGFQWVWKEWLPDLTLVPQHPRRAFMRRVLEYEIRLSYFDRIAKTLPPQMQEPDAYVLPKVAPGPHFPYEDPINPHHDSAQSILNLFRGRAKAEEVIAHLDTLKTSVEAADAGANSDNVVLSIAIQSLLHIGARSFSHLLNAIERYLPLLRHIVSHGSSDTKSEIQTSVASFWKENSQMVVIVFDKLMQYQIVDPTDVINWTFERGTESHDELSSVRCIGGLQWDLVKGALDKANGRVNIARKKVAALRKEDDDTRAQAIAKEGTAMDVDDAKPDDIPENPALTTALKAFSSLVREQKTGLSRALEGFVSCLAPPESSAHPKPESRTVISPTAWEDRANWGKEEWNVWETWCWYRHFCRVYSPYLRTYSTTLTTVSFARFEGSEDPAGALLQKIYNTSTGAD